MTRELSPSAQKAKAIRQTLKAAFPTVKFSVKSASGSIRIEWTDGAKVSQVKEITAQYESVRRCEYSGEILSGGNFYVSLQREFTPEAYTQAVENVCKYWGLPMVNVTVSEYGRAYIATGDDVANVGGGCERLCWLVDKELYDMDFTQAEAVETADAVIEPEAIAPIIETSESVQEETDEDSIDETLQTVLEMRRDRLEERQANREDAYGRLAAKHSQESDRRYQSAHSISSMIPLGQPILVGHHSEDRHRRDIERIDNNMRKSIEHDKTAAYYQDKLAAMQANTAISSDDPDALDKLKDKLQGMEESQEYMKRINGYIRQVLKLADDKQVDALAEISGMKTAEAYTLLNPRWGGKGYASYSLTNNNANMQRVKERITEIEAQHKAIAEHGESVDTEYEDLGLKVVMNLAINRLQFVFDGKPESEVRSELKSNGFRWSPRESAWQRQLNNGSKYVVERVIKELRSLKSA